MQNTEEKEDGPMTINYLVCDHCGKKLDNMNDYDGIEISISYEYFGDVDLCSDCFKEFVSKTKEYINRTAKEHKTGETAC